MEKYRIFQILVDKYKMMADECYDKAMRFQHEKKKLNKAN